MNIPKRGPAELHGLQTHSVVPMTNWQAPDGQRYIVLSLHVKPLADSGGELSALPAVCCALQKAGELRDALAAAIDAMTRPH